MWVTFGNCSSLRLLSRDWNKWKKNIDFSKYFFNQSDKNILFEMSGVEETIKDVLLYKVQQNL